MKTGLRQNWRVPLATACMLGIIATCIAWPPISTFLERRAAILVARERLDSLARRRASEAEKIRSAPSDAFLVIATDQEAETGLKEVIERAFATHQAELQILRVSRATSTSRLPLWEASIRARVPEPNLLALLQALEGGAPPLFFSTLRLRLSDQPASSDVDDRLELEATLQVYVHIRPNPGNRS